MFGRYRVFHNTFHEICTLKILKTQTGVTQYLFFQLIRIFRTFIFSCLLRNKINKQSKNKKTTTKYKVKQQQKTRRSTCRNVHILGYFLRKYQFQFWRLFDLSVCQINTGLSAFQRKNMHSPAFSILIHSYMYISSGTLSKALTNYTVPVENSKFCPI